MTIKGMFYGDKREAGEMIIATCKTMLNPEPISLGLYREIVDGEREDGEEREEPDRSNDRDER